VPIERVKSATEDKKIVVAATRDELQAMRKWEEPMGSVDDAGCVI